MSEDKNEPKMTERGDWTPPPDHGQGRLRTWEPGWTLEVRDDPSRIRGIWTRMSSPERLEICAGRQGDDCYVEMLAGQRVTPRLLHDLRNLLAHGRDPFIDYEYIDEMAQQQQEDKETNPT